MGTKGMCVRIVIATIDPSKESYLSYGLVSYLSSTERHK